jgi:hypothetical protein
MASTQAVSPWAHGIVVFAGVVMIVGGAFQALEGLAGIVHDQYLVVLPNYIYAFDITVWGVIHLLVGLGLLVIGVSLLRGKTWARIAGVIAAAVSAIVNFAWLPYSPWWAVILIVIDVLVIWALALYLGQPVPAADQDGQAAPQHNQAAAS